MLKIPSGLNPALGSWCRNEAKPGRIQLLQGISALPTDLAAGCQEFKRPEEVIGGAN